MIRNDTATGAAPNAIDMEALRRKYQAERDKRVRSDHEAQYTEVTGAFAHYYEVDPYIDRGMSREPLTDDIEVAIIGGGFSGILSAARLSQQGVDDFRIIEAAGDFGGTWYWNRYPGAQCDIDSYSYLPLLEEIGYIPKEKYSYADEIFEHSRRVGEAFGLYERTCFQTRVRSLDWDEEAARWIIRTDRGDAMRARFVITAVGSASRAKLPGIPGITDFKGDSFHTSRWDYGVTGGDQRGGMSKLADKRVAVIGTGATGVQCIPYLARDCGHLYVFQRTPSSVDVRGNKPTDPQWAATLQPGWQKHRRENFATVVQGLPFEEDLVDDSWTDIFRNLAAMGSAPADDNAANGDTANGEPHDPAAMVELADFRKMEQLRARVDASVSRPHIAAALKPWYRLFCKRPTFNDEFLPTFNRRNVTLVDTSFCKGVERITETGVVANGVEYPVDLIVFATGFEITITDFRKGIGFDINGRGGTSLYDHWAGGLSTLHGHSTHGFPNWFYIGISQNALSPNMTHMYDEQATHIAYIVAEARRHGAEVVEADPDAEAKWVALIRKLAVANHDFLESCTPGYYNNEGAPRGGIFAETYAPGINAFNAKLAEWRSDGRLAGLRLSRNGQPIDGRELTGRAA